jgi:pantoate--beta-alanine ligase
MKNETMVIIESTSELRQYYRQLEKPNPILGFVPTMGALHQGHISLVEQSMRNTDCTIVSIFVNPTQFNNPQDLATYPRDRDRDLAFLSQTGCHVVFIPEVHEVYPEPDLREFDFGSLERVMEGAFRPGHFNGVAQVVSRLFEMVQPNFAFFGQKDYQQLLIVKALVKKLDLAVKIVECPIVRESDGLAMSSRNLRLLPTERDQAGLIHKILREAVDKLHFATVENIKSQVDFRFQSHPAFRLEYFEVADPHTLSPVSGRPDGPFVACIAAWLGSVRLIDNIKSNPKR